MGSGVLILSCPAMGNKPSGDKSLDEGSPKPTELKDAEGRAKYNILSQLFFW